MTPPLDGDATEKAAQGSNIPWSNPCFGVTNRIVRSGIWQRFLHIQSVFQRTPLNDRPHGHDVFPSKTLFAYIPFWLWKSEKKTKTRQPAGKDILQNAFLISETTPQVV